MNQVVNSFSVLRKRLLFISLAIVFFVFALISRLFFVQVLSHNHLTGRATEQWYRDLPLQAPRGQILSQNGTVLAANTNLFTIYVRPRAVKDLYGSAYILSQELGMDEDDIVKKILGANVSEVTLRRGVDASVAESIRNQKLEGVYFTLDARRSYPFGNYLSQVLGFTNIDNAGQNGLELYYDKYLKGSNGFAYTGTDMRGIELKTNVTRYVPAIPGFDMTLSIDSNIQHFVEDAVNNSHKEWQAQGTSMMVYDLTTGGIVASASSPSFDLNNPPRDELDLLNQLSKNNMITDVYEPGSTFKIFTLAAALDTGVASLDDDFFCPGYRIIDGQRIRCWRRQGHGVQTLQEAINNSCNVAIMDLSQRLGTSRLYSYLKAFGFFEKTGVDFFGESRGIHIPEKDVKLVDLVRIGFGHAVAVTTLQMLAATGAVVTGTLYQPYFAKSITTLEGNDLYDKQPKTVRHPITPQTAAIMREILGKVVAEGSGRKAQVPSYPVGGKTGTAQKYKDGVIVGGKYVSSFVGFAPVNDPKYAVLLTVDEPQGYLYYGSITAAPYVGRVFESIAAYLGIPSIPAVAPSIPMPNLLGLNFSQVENILDALGLKFETTGRGDKVVATVPSFGTMLPEGDVVLVRFE